MKTSNFDLTPAIISTFCIGLLVGCGDSNNSTSTTPAPTPPPTVVDPEEPAFSATLFGEDSANVTNKYFPLKPGASLVYEGLNDEGEKERVELTISHEIRTVDGVESAIVVDRAYVDDELVEETFDWYAQDLEGNVWYMGEDSAEIENGQVISRDGSWESGLDVANVGSIAKAGVYMKSTLTEGDSYMQEIYPGEAEDTAKIDTLNVSLALNNGDTYETVKILEWNPLEPDATREFKYYAPDVGLVKEEKEDLSESLELTERSDQTMPNISLDNFSNPTNITHPYFPAVVGKVLTYQQQTDEGLEEIKIETLATTRTVMGIECVIIRDTVTLDGVLIEDTHDWFAQDNDGNVWYMGEEVDNYNYDDQGNLVNIDHEGAWEAGVDGAQPGIQMLAMPRVGDSYRKEYWAGEAEDLAAVYDLAFDITLSNGNQYKTIKIKEWNPLEEDDVGFKYYAKDIGLVRDENEEGDEFAELISINP